MLARHELVDDGVLQDVGRQQPLPKHEVMQGLLVVFVSQHQLGPGTQRLVRLDQDAGILANLRMLFGLQYRSQRGEQRFRCGQRALVDAGCKVDDCLVQPVDTGTCPLYASPAPLYCACQSCIEEARMPLSRVGSSLVALALGACVDNAEPLNSERIEAEFGNYGIDVLSYEDGLRRASLYSTHDGRKIARTYAIVHFDDVPRSLRDNEHARILDGGSIGATFKSAGWSVRKKTLHTATVNPGDDVHGIRRLMRLDGSPDLAMHVYRLHVKKNTEAIDYATIIEVYHPAYMTQERLQTLYRADAETPAGEDAIAHWRSLVLEDSHRAHDAD